VAARTRCGWHCRRRRAFPSPSAPHRRTAPRGYAHQPDEPARRRALSGNAVELDRLSGPASRFRQQQRSCGAAASASAPQVEAQARNESARGLRYLAAGRRHSSPGAGRCSAPEYDSVTRPYRLSKATASTFSQASGKAPSSAPLECLLPEQRRRHRGPRFAGAANTRASLIQDARLAHAAAR
jgi:hypothetical protein